LASGPATAGFLRVLAAALPACGLLPAFAPALLGLAAAAWGMRVLRGTVVAGRWA
jgi:hypothetical protein